MSNKFYTIKLYDTKQDGWNNNYLSIKTESNVIIDFLTLTFNDRIEDINVKEFSFLCDSAKTLIIEYHNNGFYSYENYYQLYYDNILIYSSDFGSAPESYITIDINK